MYAKKKRFPLLLLILLLILCALAGTLAAKYVASRDLPLTVTFTANLAESVTLTESQAQRQPDGTYQLTGTAAGENSYILMPGVDVPKNPRITVTGKTNIPGYLFVEVVDTLPADSGVSYTILDCWTLLADVEGINGGEVYVYNDGEKLTETFSADPVGILKDDKVYVSQKYSFSTTPVVRFYAALAECAAGENPAAVYESLKP